MNALSIGVGIIASAVLAFTLADPTWKRWEAALIERAGAWVVRELRAHAAAQDAGREAYRAAYQRNKEVSHAA